MNTQVTCTVKGKPFSLKNPVMPGAGSYGNIVEYRDLVDLGRLGALVPNSMMLKGGGPNPVNKFYRTPTGFLSSFGPNNIGVQTFIDEALPLLPAGTPIFLDLKALDMDEMEQSARLATAAKGVTAIQINLNCPYGATDAPYWTEPDKLHQLVSRVVRAAGGKPVIAAAPSGSFSMNALAEVLEDAGIDMFVAFNNIEGCAVDIRSRTVQGGGFFGAGIKPYALARCREAVSAFTVPIIAGGGITCAADIIEFIMLGAFAVKVGSANLTRPDFMHNLIDELEVLMETLGISSLDEVRGCARPVEVKLF